ncbi:hypothetical protein LQ948_16570 [Jiella sp. MQZ9-1]|uniref:hypothetical protein n=1 Tax=Jiella flava TaxID=2816857 RepID=UPI001E43DA9E|nr:hypothetical protein [Jiella flava]MCD2472823.1 hypothetical protein [Jiella flava]
MFIGGGQITALPIQSEVPEWARWGAAVVGILPALGSAARAIGPALAEIEATGLSRAARTGVKALGRQMEARAGATRPSYPFQDEPMIPPNAEVKISDFEAKRPGGLDMRHLSPEDDLARRELDTGGWDRKMKKQVLESGDNFNIINGKAGDNLYGFSSKGFPKTSDKSPYWMDEPTFRDIQARYYDPRIGAWDSPRIKNELALPCFNRADAIYRGQLTQDRPLVVSTINPATETVTYLDRNGVELAKFQRTMAGGGTQIAPAKNSIGDIQEIFGP